MAVFHAFGAKLVDLGGDQSLLAVGAVVSHDVQVLAHGAQLVFIEEEVLGAGADDDVGGDALTESPFHLREHRGDAHASSHKKEALQFAFLMFFNQLTRTTEGTHDGVEVVALVHLGQLTCSFADDLEDDDDRLPLVDDIADGEGYAFAVLIGDDNDELAGFAAERYPRGVDFHPVDLVAVEQPLADDFVHNSANF